MKKVLIINLLLFLILPVVWAEDKTDEQKTFEWEASYVGDIGRNFDGGIKKGNTLMGVLSLGATLRTDKLWRGGEFYIQSMSTHGKGLSAEFVGDQQVISSIENGNYWFFMEKLYFRQNFTKGWITIGLQNLNQDFLVSEGGANFTNSSFGIPSSYPLNFGAPIYPKTALAITGNYNFSEKWSAKVALFDGECGSLDEDKANMKWKISEDEGALLVGEFSYTTGERLQLKWGGMYHSRSTRFTDLSDSARSYRGIYGFYALADYKLINTDEREINCFVQVDYHPTHANFNPLYVGGGFVLQGLVRGRKDDKLCLGAAYARFFDHSYECDIECNYSICFNEHISIVPAFHYVIHPGGKLASLPNAAAGFLRVVLTK